MCPKHLNPFCRFSFEHSSEPSLFDQSNEDGDEDDEKSGGPEICPDGFEKFKKIQKELALIKTY